MAEWPANAETDWNTKMLAYLAIEHETDGTHQKDVTYSLVDSVKTKILTKYFTGTTDADSSTSVAHGISSTSTKLLSCNVMILSSGGNWQVSEYQLAASAAVAFDVVVTATNVVIADVGASLQSKSYVIKLEYIA